MKNWKIKLKKEKNEKLYQNKKWRTNEKGWKMKIKQWEKKFYKISIEYLFDGKKKWCCVKASIWAPCKYLFKDTEL